MLKWKVQIPIVDLVELCNKSCVTEQCVNAYFTVMTNISK